MNKEKKAQFQFAWIFAVIIGALILFLAFYFVGTILLRQRYEQETVQAQSLDILLNPFAYLGSLGATTYNPLSLQEESDIIIGCEKFSLGKLGYNEITLIEKGEVGIPRTTYDKYIFAPQPLKAKYLDALSKPFEMPWRVADIIILWPSSQEYCFDGAPSSVETEIKRLNISSIKIKTEECAEKSIRVCFDGGTGCDIKVDRASKTVKNMGKGLTVSYTGSSLMYAAIFSDPVLYECNLQRLASRLYIETEVYQKKALALNQRGCDVTYNLASLKKASKDVFNDPRSAQLSTLETAASSIKNQNSWSKCALF